MTRFGMKEADFEPLAGLMADCIRHNRAVKDEVIALRRKFHRMHYCLPEAEAAELGARILESALPSSDYARAFAESLSRRV